MKIVFILETIDAPRMMKRIQEFIEKKYDVEVYGFKHFREKTLGMPSGLSVNVIGEINQASYWRRIKTIIRGIRKVLKETKGKDVLYYIPNIDVAMFFRLLSSADYVYEESDLKHTYVHSKFVQGILERIDKRVIRNSIVSAFTSEGFVKYHFGETPPANICYVFNRLNSGILKLPMLKKRDVNIKNIRFAFVGKANFSSLYAFARTVVEKYPEHEMHFFGTTDARKDEIVKELSRHSNFHLHGRFKNPDDLPEIYNYIDIVIALYDVDSINVLYAEPNKLYEAIYFRKPIIVSSGTYLANKVNKMGVGFDIDATDTANIESFISGLTEQRIKEKVMNAEKIDRQDAINDNPALFEFINDYINKHNESFVSK